MAGRSGAGEPSVDAALTLAAAHGAELHHLAAMLTSSTDHATALVARTLLAADAGAGAEQLRTDLVRAYLRTAPRRTERPGPVRARDAADVLRTLRPRARAACALRLVADRDEATVARAVGVRPHRVDVLVPSTPGLGVALAAVADQRALSGTELDRELADEIRAATPPAGAGPRRRWRWLAAAALPLAVLVGWAAATGGPDGDEDGSGVTAVVDEGPGTDLSAVGWTLDEDGDPPRAATGLVVATVLTVTDRAAQDVSWPAPMNSHASYAVLWCDMPPAQDANLAVPSGTLTLAGDVVRLPCSGRDGSPPVTRLVPLPPGGSGSLQVEGDLPPGGGATLAVYNEDDSADVPLPRGSLVDPPPAPEDGVVLDTADTVAAPSYGRQRQVFGAAAVEVGHDSAVRVWVGRSGAVGVNVDGLPATDDGDVGAVQEWLGRGASGDSPPAPDWRQQRPDLRWGQWLAWVPGEVRTFALPEAVRPAPGERTTVIVQVETTNLEDHVQVAVLDATRSPVDTSPVEAEADPEAPATLGGHRLVGAWRLPLDGHRRELLGTVPSTGPLEPVGLVPEGSSQRLLWGSRGLVERGGQEAVELWFDSDVATAMEGLQSGWLQTLPPGDGPLHASAPVSPDGGEGLLLLYEPVSYEDFDFTGRGVPPGSWPAGEDPPRDSELAGVEPLAVVGPDDLEDGRASVELPDSGLVAARITTEGRGRIRFLIGDHAADNLWNSQGWWSSWTDEPVVSEVELSYSEGMPDRVLTVEVEDYEKFTVEVLAPGRLRP